jgi:peptidoglycan/LPS O-acetylase OafA/YrhL
LATGFPHDYRRDIDGLRAFAVAVVLGFHAFPQSVPGGFIGVDVFFVISGFLITGQLLQASADGNFSFADFYGRRVRRIFPALFLVLLAASVFGWFALLTPEYALLQKHVAASGLFSINIVSWLESGYFDTASSLKPLLHVWSLGVEEQFYLVWPLLIWWCWSRRVNIFLALAVVVVLSFLVNVRWVALGFHSAAFYLPHARLWQLGIGSLLAVMQVHRGQTLLAIITRRLFIEPTRRDEALVANLLATIGLPLLVLSVIAMRREPSSPSWWSDGAILPLTIAVRAIGRILSLDGTAVAYPGWSAVAPTLGAALVIAAGPGAWANRTLLSTRLAVGVGLISYPLYLWHWPILSFLHIMEGDDVSRRLRVGGLALAFVLATLTYVLVERPIRRGVTIPTRWRLVALAAPVAVLAVVMLAGTLGGVLQPPARSAMQLAGYIQLRQNRAECLKRFPNAGEYCQLYSSENWPVTTAVIGDSHGHQLFPGFGAAFASRHENVAQLGHSRCPPLLDLELIHETGEDRCTRVNAAMLNDVANDPGIKNVMMIFRGALYMTGQEYPESDHPIELIRIVGGSEINADAIGVAARRTLPYLIEHGKRVTLVAQIPEMGFRTVECVGRPLSWSRRPPRMPCGISRTAVLERQRSFRELVSQLKQEFPVRVYDPLDEFCQGEWCLALSGDQMLYSDDNHLGMEGALWAMRHFTPDPAGDPPSAKVRLRSLGASRRPLSAPATDSTGRGGH